MKKQLKSFVGIAMSKSSKKVKATAISNSNESFDAVKQLPSGDFQLKIVRRVLWWEMVKRD